MTPSTTLRQAQAALELVAADPREADRRARAVLRRSQRDVEGTVTAMWALGRAQHELGNAGEASTTLREASRRAARAGLDTIAANVRVSRSACLVTIGATAEALRELHRATTQLEGADRARAITQRGLVLAQVGRLRDAIEEFDRAAGELAPGLDEVARARLHSNRGLARALLGELAAAEDDLALADEIAQRLGLGLVSAHARHNRAVLHGRRGDIPVSLRWFETAAAAYAQLGDPASLAPMLDSDLCEVLLLAGLSSEARAAADRAVANATRCGNVVAEAEGRLLLARAHMAAEDYETATAQARLASRIFKRAGRASWVALADYIGLQAEIVHLQDLRRPPSQLLARGLAIAQHLETHGWSVEALHVRTFVGRMAIALGRMELAHDVLASASDARQSGTAEQRTAAWHATALLRYAAGDPAGARRALTSGLAVLDDHRALLGATELRAHAASHGAELARLGLRISLGSGRPRDVLEWSERTRAAALALPLVRPPDDDAIADLLAQWRQASADARDALLDGEPTQAARQRADALEQQIRAGTRLAYGSGADRGGGCDVVELLDRLGERVLVEFVELEGGLHAVVAADGRVHLREVGAMYDVGNDIDFARLYHQRLAFAGGGRLPSSVPARFAEAVALLDLRLLAPLALPTGRDVVVVPTGVLHAVPWGALPTLHARTVTVTPSAASWCRLRRSAKADPVAAGDPAVTLVAGPDLDGALAEVEGLAGLYRSARVLVGAAATVEAVLHACESSRLVHIAAHGDFRADSPMFSSLRLADGQLTVYDLERLRVVPMTMVLPACDAARADVRAGDELIGTATAFLSLGVRSVIAPVTKIPDNATARVALDLHEGLRNGVTPSASLATAARRARERGFEADAAVAGALVCVGADERDDERAGGAYL